MAPPETPSPHRFLPTANPSKVPPPPSSLRFQSRPSHAPPSSSQFAPTPRFTFSSTLKPLNATSTPAAQYSSPTSLQPRRSHGPPLFPPDRKKQPQEDIDDDSGSSSGSGSEKQNYIDPDDEFGFAAAAAQSATQPPTTTNKRCKLDPEPITISSSPAAADDRSNEDDDNDNEPPTTAQITHQKSPLPTHPAPPPKFLFPHNPSQSLSTSISYAPIPSRPPLLLPPSRSRTPPPAGEEAAAAALFFSPTRRRGGGGGVKKYVPGGVAARVRGWVVASAGAAAGLGRRGDRNGEGREVVVKEVGVAGEGGEGMGVGMRVVRDEAGRGWILVGEGRKGIRRVRRVDGDVGVGVGDVVRVREPMWEVELVGEKWWVCVDWGVD